jgi:hypothetical protein
MQRLLQEDAAVRYHPLPGLDAGHDQDAAILLEADFDFLARKLARRILDKNIVPIAF